MTMAADPWSAGALLVTFAMWVVMMLLMMLPSATPFLRVVAASGATLRDASLSKLSVPAVAGGYWCVWAAFSALATLSQALLVDRGLLGADLRAGDGRLAAALLALAGFYQLSPWKFRLLSRCVHPVALLLRHSGGGARASFALGAHYGMICLGCCAPLMLVLFAVGVMNVAWIVALAAFVFAEKYGLGGALLPRAAGVALLAYAAYRSLSG